MKLTEEILIKGFAGLTNGGDIISIINGKKIYWNYRTDYSSRADGYSPVSDPDTADAIYLEHSRTGRITLNHDDRADYSRIAEAFEQTYGTTI